MSLRKQLIEVKLETLYRVQDMIGKDIQLLQEMLEEPEEAAL